MLHRRHLSPEQITGGLWRVCFAGAGLLHHSQADTAVRAAVRSHWNACSGDPFSQEPKPQVCRCPFACLFTHSTLLVQTQPTTHMHKSGADVDGSGTHARRSCATGLVDHHRATSVTCASCHLLASFSSVWISVRGQHGQRVTLQTVHQLHAELQPVLLAPCLLQMLILRG